MVLPLIAMLATMAMSLLLVRKAVAWGFVDFPGDRKVHTQPTPRTGGLAMVFGAGLTLVLSLAFGWVSKLEMPWQTWLAGTGFVAVGALDDRFTFHPRQKLLVFLSLSALAAWPWVLVIGVTGVPWLPQAWTTLPIFLIPVTIILTFWFMAVPNAVNIEDAINGYMGGYTFIVLFALNLRGVDFRIALGSILGFLFLNWPRAKHFMGDAGSFGCGFLIAEGILRGGGMAHPMMALAFTAPISMDVAMGLIRRNRLRISYFTPDRSTCPHHVLSISGGHITGSALALWLNALGFTCLIRWPFLLLGQTVLYAVILFYFNKNALFNRTNIALND